MDKIIHTGAKISQASFVSWHHFVDVWSTVAALPASLNFVVLVLLNSLVVSVSDAMITRSWV